MNSTQLHIIAVNGMLTQSTEMLELSYHDPSIDQNRYIGEKLALERVLRYLKSQADLEVTHKVTLDESLALMNKDGK